MRLRNFLKFPSLKLRRTVRGSEYADCRRDVREIGAGLRQLLFTHAD
jgi:hypothetical protein